MRYAEPIARLISELTKLPGIGPKSAQRLAFHLLFRPRDEVLALTEAMIDARDRIRPCSECGQLTDQDPCAICTDPQRRPDLICVVEQPRDVIAMERAGDFRGHYHVLHGAISPLDGVGPDDLTIGRLLQRVNERPVTEVILATNPNVEGEATAMYIARLLKPLGIRVTRIARGLPEGGDLDYADDITLARALEGRREL